MIGPRASITIPPVTLNDNIYGKALSFDELYKSLKKCRRNVMWKDSVAGYSINALKNTYKLRQSLLKHTYKLDPYQIFRINEPKEREIVATRIKDRQFQRSLCDNVLYPEVTKSFVYDNCACQRGKGVDFALDRLNCHLQRHFRQHGLQGWALQCDIRHFFAETPHTVAKAAIAKRVSCPEAIAHTDAIIDSFGGDRGIGLGSQVSQITQLAVLDDLDHYIKERLRIKGYIRYMDDFLLIHPDRGYLERCLIDITAYLAAIGLELNKKTHIFPVSQGIVFLKWRFHLTDTGKVVRRMSQKSINRERRKLKKLKVLLDGGRITMQDVENNYQSWKANAQRGNTRDLLLKMDEHYKNRFIRRKE